jgi:hypothetical protein
MKVCVFVDRHPRSSRLGEALLAGANRVGWNAFVTKDFHETPRADLVAAYGWRNRAVLEAYRNAGLHYIHVDLGYWRRKQFRSDYGGLHKVVLDDRHATAYFRRGRPHDRLQDAPRLDPWRTGGSNIVLAGLSAKSAQVSGVQSLAWEHRIIEQLRRVTARPIVYRPKPSWQGAQPIDGTIFSPPEQPLDDVLADARVLLTLHSNAALDALAAGVPVLAEEGLASVMSTVTIDEIETPHEEPGDRAQFFADVSYCHWTRHEIADGTVFALLQADGLL